MGHVYVPHDPCEQVGGSVRKATFIVPRSIVIKHARVRHVFAQARVNVVDQDASSHFVPTYVVSFRAVDVSVRVVRCGVRYPVVGECVVLVVQGVCLKRVVRRAERCAKDVSQEGDLVVGPRLFWCGEQGVAISLRSR